MIILQSLKYFIYDYCLTNLFEGFQKNFQIKHERLIYVKDLYVGKKLNKIKRGLSDQTYYNCEILAIKKIISSREENGTAITFISDFLESYGVRKSGRTSIIIIWDNNYTMISLIDFS